MTFKPLNLKRSNTFRWVKPRNFKRNSMSGISEEEPPSWGWTFAAILLHLLKMVRKTFRKGQKVTYHWPALGAGHCSGFVPNSMPARSFLTREHLQRSSRRFFGYWLKHNFDFKYLIKLWKSAFWWLFNWERNVARIL